MIHLQYSVRLCYQCQLESTRLYDVVIGFQIIRVGPRQRLFVSLVGPSVKTKKLDQNAIKNTGRTK